MAGLMTDIKASCLMAMEHVWHAGTDFIYPPCCVLCREEPEFGSCPAGASALNGRMTFCEPCREDLLPPIPSSCARCGAKVGPHLDTRNGCAVCAKERYAFDKVIRLGLYEQRLREACLRAKEFGAEPLLAGLAELLWEQERDALESTSADLVLPVPHHWWQRLRRPHNPASILADVLARRLKVPTSRHILAKIRRTPAQSSLTGQERRKNLRGAFRARPTRRLNNATVLLVDDVVTTGATAHEAAKCLRKAGAKQVVVAAIARADGRSFSRRQ